MMRRFPSYPDGERFSVCGVGYPKPIYVRVLLNRWEDIRIRQEIFDASRTHSMSHRSAYACLIVDRKTSTPEVGLILEQEAGEIRSAEIVGPGVRLATAVPPELSLRKALEVFCRRPVDCLIGLGGGLILQAEWVEYG